MADTIARRHIVRPRELRIVAYQHVDVTARGDHLSIDISAVAAVFTAFGKPCRILQRIVL
jgi:hypothetical protein